MEIETYSYFSKSKKVLDICNEFEYLERLKNRNYPRFQKYYSMMTKNLVLKYSKNPEKRRILVEENDEKSKIINFIQKINTCKIKEKSFYLGNRFPISKN